ncbi:uncharacterized protein THITE_13184, partial [Thermothielavioides terrestris NRRL 8126]
KKPYHAKRPHRKSRTGCRNCKARKVKCDEARPVCGACAARDEKCLYVAAPKHNPSPSSSSPGQQSASSLALADTAVTHPHPHPQPLFIAGGHDELDMRLLWFYTAATYASFSTGKLKERSVDVILKVNVVKHAFANPFLMNCVLALSAMHINHLGLRNIGVTRQHEIRYRARAFETCRKAVQAADPATYQALLASSLLLCGLATHVFRGEDARPLAVLDWMLLWKGIGSIIEIVQSSMCSGVGPLFYRSGVGPLFSRPKVDLAASARCLPSYLLFMIDSIKPGEPEFPLVQSYYKALQFLGSLYLELNNGFSQLLRLRIVTLITFLPPKFIEAARERRPRALVIVAHYLVFAKLAAKTCWWLDGISEHEIPNIHAFLGPEWHSLLRVPMAALLLANDRDIARLLLDDPTWD